MSLFEKMNFTPILRMDRSLQQWVAVHQRPFVKRSFQMATLFGSGYFWTGIYAAMILFGTRPWCILAASMIAAELLGLLVIIVCRSVFKRKRPSSSIRFLIRFPWSQNSFPSHHALRASFLSILIGMNAPWLLGVFLGMAIVISASRIYLEKHYLSDVLAGMMAGILCAGFVLDFFGTQRIWLCGN